MKTKVYKLVTKPGLTKPLLNEIKVLLKNNYDVVHETKSEIKISSVFENMVCLYEKSRLIDNISVQLCRDLRVDSEKTLKIKLKNIPFEDFLPFQVQNKYYLPLVTCVAQKSKLYHDKMVSNIVKSYINRSAFVVKSSDNLDKNDEKNTSEVNKSSVDVKKNYLMLPKLKVYLYQDLMNVYMDLFIDSLGKRGYKVQTSDDSLKESIASSLVQLSGAVRENGPDIIWDPFCGCGTILIEMLLNKSGIDIRDIHNQKHLIDIPYINQESDVMKLITSKTSNKGLVNVLKSLASKLESDKSFKVYGSDISNNAISNTIENFKKANLSEPVSISSESLIKSNPLIFRESINRYTDLLLGDYEKIFEIIKNENPLIQTGTNKLSIVTHLPYLLNDNISATIKLYQEFGKFLRKNFDCFESVIILIRKRDKKDKLNFENLTNMAWTTLAEINNQGIQTQIIKLKNSN